jgi:hypothetical protein
MMDNTKQGRIDSVSKVKTNDYVIVHDIQWLFSYLYLMFISKMIFTKRHSTHQIKTHFKLLHG